MHRQFLLLTILLLSLFAHGSSYAQDSRDNPSADGWKSEAVASEIQSSIKRILHLTLQRKHGEIADLVASEATGQQATPENLIVVRDDELATLSRLDSRKLADAKQIDLQDSLSSLFFPYTDLDTVKFRLKTTRIDLKAEDFAAATFALHAFGTTKSRSLQTNVTLLTNWTLAESKFKLSSLQIEGFEVANLKTESKKWFTDISDSLLGGQAAYDVQLKHGLGDWINRIEKFAGSNIYSRHGHAVGDVNGDGLDDIYVCQPGGLPNLLFKQQTDGSFTDVSRDARVDWLNSTKSALLIDLDNDGDQDLVVGTTVGVHLCRNDGKGTFTHAGQLDGIEMDVSSLSSVDYDSDGDLDLYVCVYHSDARNLGQDDAITNEYDTRSKGGTNRIYKNLLNEQRTAQPAQKTTEFRFSDVTTESGLGKYSQRYSLSAAWEDFDSDGDQDLFVANDFGHNTFYRNDDGAFSEVSSELNVAGYGAGMSAAWGDYNRDGSPDIYIGNMFSSAGNRITRQEKFSTTTFGTTRETFQRFAKGNSLYSFRGDSFKEIPFAGGAEKALWAWTSLLADIDNDGWEDAVVANGYISGHCPGDL